MGPVLQPIVGNWAGGDCFFGRDLEVADLMRRVRRGASVSLSAPRRVGKTSLLQEVRRQLDGQMTCIFVDFEGAATVEDAIAEIAEKAAQHRALARRVGDWAASMLGTTELDLQVAKVDLRDALKVDWQTRGSRLVTELCAGDRPVVIFMDELPVLVANLLDISRDAPGRNQADLFLSWLRRMVQEHPDRLRVVLTGSIGLAPMVARAGLSATLNVYESETLGPWSREISIEAMHALARFEELDLSADAASTAHGLLGIGIPYYVQLVHQALAEDARRRRSVAISAADVARVWTDRILARPNVDLPHWEQRLRKALGTAEYALAITLLTEASLHEPLSVPRALELCVEVPDPADALRGIPSTLEHDGYLARRSDGGWYFPNRLLKTWWASEYGLLHGYGSPR